MGAKVFSGRNAKFSWDGLPDDTSDAEFARKLEKWDMLETYQEEADKRGITLRELYAAVIREALE